MGFDLVKIMNSKDTVDKDRLTKYILFAVSLFPIFPNALQSIVFVVLNIMLFNLKTILSFFKLNKLTLFFFILSIVSLFTSFIYSKNKSGAFEYLKVQYCIWLGIPILLSNIPKLSSYSIKVFQILFSTSLLIYIVLWIRYYFHGYELFDSLNHVTHFVNLNIYEKLKFFLENQNNYYYAEIAYHKSNLKLDFFNHYIYLNILFLFGIIIQINLIRTNSNNWIKVLGFVNIVIFLLFVFYMPSESKYLVFIVATIILISNVPNLCFKIIISLILLFIGFYLAYNYISIFRLVNNNDDVSGKFGYLIDYQRYLIYSSVWSDFSSSNQLIGNGIGDLQSRLKEIIPISQWALDFDNKPSILNTHNQYLDILYSRGWLGFVSMLLAMIGLIKIIALKWKNLTAFFFIMFVFFMMNFENILNRAWGNYIIYFSILFFAIVHKSNSNAETH